MKIVIDVHGEYALVFWKGNITPYVVVLLEDKTVQVGDYISNWYHGDYFRNLKTALTRFETRGGKNYAE